MAERFKLEVTGIDRNDAQTLARILGVDAAVTPLPATATRGGSELISAAFLLGLMNALPAVMNPLIELLMKLREEKFIKFKFADEAGNVIEGAATPDRIRDLASTMRKIHDDAEKK